MLRLHSGRRFKLRRGGCLKLVVVGNGIAGISAALAFRRMNRDAQVTIISDESELFYSRTALMYIYMRDLKFEDTIVHPAAFYRKQDIELCFDTVLRIDFGTKQVLLKSKNTLSYDYLLLAPGSRPRMPGIPGENLDGVRGLYSLQDLERLEKDSHRGISRAVIVGGGLIGVELAEMLRRRGIPVTFLVRDPLYFSAVLPQEEAELITAEIRSHGIDLRLSTQLKKIEGSQTCDAAITHTGESIPCSFVGLTVGVEPRLELAEGTALKRNRGILTNASLQSNLPEVFAAGDAAEVILPGGEKKVQQLWYTGRMQGNVAGENIARAMAGEKLEAYDPGIFFNSAKFFTVEYQTYGSVPANASSHDSILWQDQKKKKLIRIAFSGSGQSRAVTGFNVLGVRYRQQVCENWIRDKAPLARVVSELARANFDPEFYRHFDDEFKRITA